MGGTQVGGQDEANKFAEEQQKKTEESPQVKEKVEDPKKEIFKTECLLWMSTQPCQFR